MIVIKKNKEYFIYEKRINVNFTFFLNYNTKIIILQVVIISYNINEKFHKQNNLYSNLVTQIFIF